MKADCLAAHEHLNAILLRRDAVVGIRAGESDILGQHLFVGPHHAVRHELELSIRHDPDGECGIQATPRHRCVAHLHSK